MNKENREPAAKRAKINKQTQPAATMNSEENMVRFYIFLYVKHNNSVTGSFVRENFRAFFKEFVSGGGGGHLPKGTILYRVWRNDRWFVGNKKFGVVSHLLVGGGGSGGILPQKIFVFFYPYDCNSLHFLNLQLSTCIVCLCRYQNLAVTQGASLINLEGLTPTKRHHGWHRAKEF